MKRKFIALMLIGMICLVNVGCGKTEKEANSKESATDLASATEQTEEKINTDEANGMIERVIVPVGKTGTQISIVDTIDEWIEAGFSECVYESGFAFVVKGSADAWNTKISESEEVITSFVDSLNELDDVESVEIDEAYKTITVKANSEKISGITQSFSKALLLNVANYLMISGEDYSVIDTVLTYVYPNGTEETITYQEECLSAFEKKEYVDYSLKTETTTVEATETEEIEIPIVSVADGETIVVEDICEFTISGWGYDDEIWHPKAAAKMITGGGENTKVLWLNVSHKNLGTENASQYHFADDVVLTYLDKYKYEGGAGSFNELIPLAETDAFIYSRIPNTLIEDESGAMVMEFVIGNTCYQYVVR